jgi:hypothetical protein
MIRHIARRSRVWLRDGGLFLQHRSERPPVHQRIQGAIPPKVRQIPQPRRAGARSSGARGCLPRRGVS